MCVCVFFFNFKLFFYDDIDCNAATIKASRYDLGRFSLSFVCLANFHYIRSSGSIHHRRSISSVRLLLLLENGMHTPWRHVMTSFRNDGTILSFVATNNIEGPSIVLVPKIEITLHFGRCTVGFEPQVMQQIARCPIAVQTITSSSSCPISIVGKGGSRGVVIHQLYQRK